MTARARGGAPVPTHERRDRAERVPLDAELLTTREAAEFFKVHPSSIRRWTRAGQLPFVRIGIGRMSSRTLRYRRADLLLVVASSRGSGGFAGDTEAAPIPAENR